MSKKNRHSQKKKGLKETKEDLLKFMTYKDKKEKQEKKPLYVYKINDKYILAVYQGSLSKYDIVLRYRQKDEKGRWSNIRTPKHIHWAVDMLIKLYGNEEVSKKFLDFLIEQWDKVEGFKSEEDRQRFLSEEFLLKEVEKEAEKFLELSKYGEYNIKFLILLAILLMKQGKN